MASAKVSTITLAELYVSQGHLEQAWRVLLEVCRREPANAQARQRLAEVEQMLEITPDIGGGQSRTAKLRALLRQLQANRLPFEQWRALRTASSRQPPVPLKPELDPPTRRDICHELLRRISTRRRAL